MTQVARVFVFLNLVLAAAFLAAAATFLGLKQDYMKELDAKKTALTQLEQDKQAAEAALNTQINDLRRANGEMSRQVGEKDTTIRGLNEQITSLNSQITEKDNQIRTISANESANAATVERMRGDNTNLQTKAAEEESKARNAVKAQMDAVAAKEQAEAEARELRTTINDLEQQIHTQNGQIDDLRNMVDYAQANGIVFTGTMIPTPVTGLVLNFDPETNLVQVNQGEEAGVKRGYELDVTYAGSYLGRMIVDGTTASTCYGTMRVFSPGVDSIPVGAGATNRLN